MYYNYKPRADFNMNEMYRANLVKLNEWSDRLKTEKDEYTRKCLEGKIRSVRVVILEIEKKFTLTPQQMLRAKASKWL